MDAILRQSKAVCPFLKTATPATLRTLSSTARHQASPCGGTMSKLQLYAHRCPVMGKALAVQSSKHGAAAAIRALSTQSKAKIHTSSNKGARAMETPIFNRRDKGMWHQAAFEGPSNKRGPTKPSG